jgi:plasmid maintenance system antidote protein VapI
VIAPMAAQADDPRSSLTPSVSLGKSPLHAGRTDATAGSVPGGSGEREVVAVPGRELSPHEVLVRHALEVSRLTVTRMAEELGIPRATLEAYRLGTRRMPAAARLRLSAYLAQHAEILRLLSQALGALD